MAKHLLNIKDIAKHWLIEVDDTDLAYYTVVVAQKQTNSTDTCQESLTKIIMHSNAVDSMLLNEPRQ